MNVKKKNYVCMCVIRVYKRNWGESYLEIINMYKIKLKSMIWLLIFYKEV